MSGGAGPGPICTRCNDDYWQLSGRGWCIPCEKRTYAAEQLREIARELGQVAACGEGEPRWNAYRIVEHLADHADRIERL